MTTLKDLFTELEDGFICGEPTEKNLKLDQLHSEIYSAKIERFIIEFNISEQYFKKIASKFMGLDLIYSDYKN